MRIFTSGAILALVLGASFAQAAGLGKLTVNSALGQVLNAEIDLVSVEPGELDAFNARVAPPEAFRDARIEYSGSLRLLRFAVDTRPNGRAFLKVTSVAPINEPFIDLLIEVSWPAGRIQREYPILLDPPGYAQGKASPPTVAAAAAPRATETPPAPAPAASSPQPATSAPAAPSTSSSASPTADAGTPSARAELGGSSASAGSSGDSYGPVQSGENLRRIAEQVKPADVSLDQMLVALYRENKAAFINNNMNRLKTGQILKVPSAEQVAQLERAEVNQEIRTHVADWRAYREQLAGGVAASPEPSRPAATNVAAGSVASAAVAPPPAPSAAPQDMLKLSKTAAPAKAAASGKGGAGGTDRLNALQEELTAKDQALRESQSRVAELEKQIRDMQRLLDLKAGVAGKAADPKVAAAPVPAPATAPAEPKADTKLAEAPKVEPPKTEPSPAESKSDTGPPETVTTPEPAPVAQAPKPAPPKVAAAQKPAPKKAPPPEKSFTDELLDNPAILGGIGLLAAAGIAGFLFMRRRRRDDVGTGSAMASAFPSDLKPDATTGKAGGGLVDTGNSSFLTDFDKTGSGSLDTDEVDPVAEAEVYIAYGRDAQAEEILKEAMARDKGRHEIPLKLLEIYHARKSATAFETVAKELRNLVGESSPVWQKAAAMGAQIDPGNSLYAAAASGTATYTAMAPSAPAAKPDVDFDIAGSSASSAPAPDFDLDLDGKKDETVPVADLHSGSSAMDFDLDAPASAPAPAAEPAKEDKPSFDFDLSGLDFPGASKGSGGTDLDVDPTRPSSGSGGGLDLADLSLDAGGAEAVGTKLELAKAYLEIGDKDGAREILHEVAKEGSATQKDEAQKLIASL